MEWLNGLSLYHFALGALYGMLLVLMVTSLAASVLQKGRRNRMGSQLRRMKRGAGFARRKVATALAWARYVESEQRAGRVPMSKVAWRVQAARSQSVEAQSPETALRAVP